LISVNYFSSVKYATEQTQKPSNHFAMRGTDETKVRFREVLNSVINILLLQWPTERTVQ